MLNSKKLLNIFNGLFLTLIIVVFQVQANTYEWRGFAGGGLFPTVAVDPQNPNIVYAASDVSGMYKSINKGDNWTPIDDINLRSHAIAYIRVDPSNSDRVWACSADGLLLSVDQGLSWAIMENRIRCHILISLDAIAISQDGRTIFVASNKAIDEVNTPFENNYNDFNANGSLFRSTDGGDNFFDVTNSIFGAPFPMGSNVIQGTHIPSVQFLPASNTTAFVLIDGKRIVKTSNASSISSLSFVDFSNATPALSFNQMRLKHLVVGSNKIYFTAEPSSNISNSLIYISDVTNANWQLRVAGFLSEESPSKALPIVLNPQNDSLVYLGYEQFPNVFYNSNNNGLLWNGIPVIKNMGINSTYFFDELATSHQAWNDPFQSLISLAIDPSTNSQTLYSTTWFGIWRSIDGGAKWYEKVKGTQGTVTADIAFQNGVLFSSNWDVFLHKSMNLGLTWTPSLPKAGETLLASQFNQGRDIEISNDQTTIYNAIATSLGVRVYKSINSGNNWTQMSMGLDSVSGNPLYNEITETNLAVSAFDNNSLYITLPHHTIQGVYKWDNITSINWRKLGTLNGAANSSDINLYKCIATDPTNSMRLFLGTYFHGLWVSNDDGVSWIQATGNQSIDISSQSVQEIIVLNNGNIWAAFANGIYKSIDHGTSFTLATLPNIRFGETTVEYFSDVEINPDNMTEMFASTSKKVPVYANSGSIWHSIDSGNSWQEITGSLIMKRINAIEYYNGYLYLATEGANVLRTKINNSNDIIFIDGFE